MSINCTSIVYGEVKLTFFIYINPDVFKSNGLFINISLFSETELIANKNSRGFLQRILIMSLSYSVMMPDNAMYLTHLYT